MDRAPKSNRIRATPFRSTNCKAAKKLDFEDFAYDPKDLQETEMVQVNLKPHSFKPVNKKLKLDDEETHHNHTKCKISYKPLNLFTVDLRMEELVIDPTDIGQFEINEERVQQQIRYWVDLKEPNKRFINSLVTATAFETPYKLFDYKDELPMIGIYKAQGKLKGQAVWITLPEANMLIKLFVYLLERKAAELNGETLTQFKLSMNFDKIEYIGHDFVGLGVARDRVYPQEVEEAGLEEVTEMLKKQLTLITPRGDASYPIGSVDVITATLERRPLFSLLKKTGHDAGQRIWFSCFELQYLIVDLVERVKSAFEKLKAQKWKS
jgi:hypothetical protein